MKKPKLLVIEDEESIRNQMKWALSDEYEVIPADNRTQALQLARKESPQVILLDLGLPPSPRTAEEGLSCLREILRADSMAKVIVVTGNQERENALKAIEHGAFDFFLKPAKIEEIKVVLGRALHLSSLEKENVSTKAQEILREFGEIVGESTRMQHVFSVVRKVACTDAPILLEGESGTGKEIIARAIHRLGNEEGKGAFIAINCGAIPGELLESELFGHEKGSFTGAHAQRKGKIEYAEGGTLFLDEIGELPLLLQVKLLRFLQEYDIERVGGRELIRVSARVIAATNCDLDQKVKEGRFREDLYYRLGVVTLKIPPLRERGEDVILLGNYLLKKATAQYGKQVVGFTADALGAIRSYSWPGNVRELENKIRRAVIMSDKKYVTPVDLNLPEPDRIPTNGSLKDLRDQVEKEHIAKVLARNKWNVSRSAVELEISRPTLHDLIKKHRLQKDP